jgi:hypothetical protein
MHVADYFVEYIHTFDTLLINYVPKFPPRLCSKRRCCCRPPPLADNHYHLAVLPPPSSLQRGKDKDAGLRRIANDGQGMVVVVFVVVVAASAATVSPLPLPLLSPSLLSSSSLDRRRPPV